MIACVDSLENRSLFAAGLVADLSPGGAFPEQVTPFGSYTVFTGVSVQHGRELWITDGTAGRTRLLADVQPGVPSSGVSIQAATDQAVFFLADGGSASTRGVYASGTKPGSATFLLRKGTLGTIKLSQSFSGFTRVGDRVFFFRSVYDGTTPPTFELWTSGGTAASTRLLHTFSEIRGTSAPMEVNGRAFFTVTREYRPGRFRQEVWFSDGTPAGTAYTGFAPDSVTDMIGFGGQLFLSAGTSSGRGLWSLSPSGRARAVLQIGDVRFVHEGTNTRSLFFVSGAKNTGYRLHRLSKSGIETIDFGSQVTIDPNAGLRASPAGLTATIGRTFYRAYNSGTVAEPWFSLPDPSVRTPGTGAIVDSAIAGGSLYALVADRVTTRLFRVDESLASRAVAAVARGSRLSVAGNSIIHVQADTDGMNELFSSTPVSDAVQQLTDPKGSPAGSYPDSFVTFKGRLHFVAEHQRSRDRLLTLYRMDATPVPIATTTSTLLAESSRRLVASDNWMMLQVWDSGFLSRLLVTNGTSAFREVVPDAAGLEYIGAAKDRFYFLQESEVVALNSVTGRLSAVGVAVAPRSGAVSSLPLVPTRAGGSVYFGYESSLYRTDGSSVSEVGSRLLVEGDTRLQIHSIHAVGTSLIVVGVVKGTSSGTVVWRIQENGAIGRLGKPVQTQMIDAQVDPTGSTLWMLGGDVAVDLYRMELATGKITAMPRPVRVFPGTKIVATSATQALVTRTDMAWELFLVDPVSGYIAVPGSRVTHTATFVGRDVLLSNSQSEIRVYSGGENRVVANADMTQTQRTVPPLFYTVGNTTYFRARDLAHGSEVWSYTP